jgi:uncharacterized membrane protein
MIKIKGEKRIELKIKILNGIFIIDILSVLLILSIIFIPSTVARAILGLPFLLFFPGYTLVAALFIKKAINNIERIALSCVLSIAIVGLIGFGLNYTYWGIKLMPVLYSITAFIFLMSAITLIMRAWKLKTNIFISEFSFDLPGWGPNKFNKYLSIVLIITIFSALGVLSYTIVEPRIAERYTEFYILGITGRAQDYPVDYVIDNGKITQVIYNNGAMDTTSGMGIVTLGIVNHEQQTVDYSVKMTIDGEPVDINFDENNIGMIGPIELKQGEKWEKIIGIVPLHLGENQKVEFLLYKGGQIAENNSLRLWINVKSAQ